MHKNRCKYTDFSKYQQIIPPFFRLSLAKMLSPIITFYQTTAPPYAHSGIKKTKSDSDW